MATASDAVIATALSYTEASVVCDALNNLERAIDMTGARPWETYDGDEPDGPENGDSYRAAIKTAHAKRIAVIEAS